MLGALGILLPEILEKYAGIEFGVRVFHKLPLHHMLLHCCQVLIDGTVLASPILSGLNLTHMSAGASMVQSWCPDLHR